MPYSDVNKVLHRIDSTPKQEPTARVNYRTTPDRIKRAQHVAAQAARDCQIQYNTPGHVPSMGAILDALLDLYITNARLQLTIDEYINNVNGPKPATVPSQIARRRSRDPRVQNNKTLPADAAPLP